MEANDLQGVTNLDPRGMVGMVYVGDHPTLLYTCTKWGSPYIAIYMY